MTKTVVKMQESKNVSLTDRQERFCEEYLLDLNATQAAIRAGYSPESARVTACRMLTNANIQAEIQEKKAKRTARSESDGDMVIAELEKLGFAPLGELPAASKVRALELLGRHHGVIGDKRDVRGNHGFQLILGKKE